MVKLFQGYITETRREGRSLSRSSALSRSPSALQGKNKRPDLQRMKRQCRSDLMSGKKDRRAASLGASDTDHRTILLRPAPIRDGNRSHEPDREAQTLLDSFHIVTYNYI